MCDFLGISDIKAQQPFVIIKEGLEKIGDPGLTLEPKKKASTSALGAIYSDWLPRLDEVRTYFWQVSVARPPKMEQQSCIIIS
jgi:hypothetical protein